MNRREHATLAISLHSLSHSLCVYGGGVIKIERLIVEYAYCTGLGRDGVTAVLLVGCINISWLNGHRTTNAEAPTAAMPARMMESFIVCLGLDLYERLLGDSSLSGLLILG